MKKVLVVTESNSVWGAERSLLALAEHADSNEVKLHFLISNDSPLSSELEKLGLPYSRHEFADHPALSSAGSLSAAGPHVLFGEVRSVLLGALAIWRKLRGYDSILVFSIWQAPETILASWLARTPVDVDLHETFGNRRAMKLVGWIAQASRRVIVPSFVLADKSGLTASRRVSIVPRPVPAKPDIVWERSSHELPITVGVFGQIQPHKNVLAIAQQLASADVPVRLLVVGGNPIATERTDYELSVRELVSSMPHRSAVIDYVQDVGQLMGECDVVVNASEHEAFGRTIVEAVSVGCYPISVGDWGPRETILSLGVGSTLDRVEDLRVLIANLSLRRKNGPLMSSIPAGLCNYDETTVARSYFSLIRSGVK